ncbi:MAG: PaaI family thioesterase [Ruminococcus sp.]|nr:PaaI family thioesterase [Ruminococcus sp.]
MNEMLEKVRQQFANDRFATENDMVIDEIGDGYARCSVVLTERHRNAMGGVMGGVHFTLADFAFAVASNWQEMKTVALNTDISFIGAVKGSKLTAEAVIVKDGRSTNCCHITVKDDLGNVVADVKTIGFHK